MTDKSHHAPQGDGIHRIYLLIDILVISACLYLSCGGDLAVLRDREGLLRAFFGAITVLLLAGMHMYKTERALSIAAESANVVKAALAAFIITSAAAALTGIHEVFYIQFASHAALMTAVLCLWRAFKRLAVRYLVSRGLNNLDTLIVGSCGPSKRLVGELDKRPYLGFRVVGLIISDGRPAEECGKYILPSGIGDLENVIHRNFVDEIFVDEEIDAGTIEDIAGTAREHNIGMKVFGSASSPEMSMLKKYDIGDISVIEFCERKKLEAVFFTKRLMDLCISLALSVLLMPVFALISVAIMLDDGWPPFYVNKRRGGNGRVFNLYKFRTMKRGSELMKEGLRGLNEVESPLFKIKDDPRITRLGRFLRRYSLDELPQLLNVIKNDMSLVGPRPLVLEEIDENDLAQLKRLRVKSGMTGLWQVRGRNDVSFNRFIKWDLWYVSNFSPGLDLKIMFMTIPIVIKGRGAY